MKFKRRATRGDELGDALDRARGASNRADEMDYALHDVGLYVEMIDSFDMPHEHTDEIAALCRAVRLLIKEVKEGA